MRRLLNPGLCALAVIPIAPAAFSQGRPQELRSIAAVLALTNQEAEQHIPVHLRALVTLNAPDRYYLFLQSGEQGIYASFDSDHPLPIKAGDLIDLKGTTDRGSYAPILRPEAVEVIAHPGLPTPIPADAAALLEDRYSNALVELEGTVTAVRRASQTGRSDDSVLLHVGDSDFESRWPAGSIDSVKSLFGARVRVRAILGCDPNPQGQRRGAKLIANSREDLKVLAAGTTDWPDLALTDLSRLLRYRGIGRLGDRVRVRGVLTLFTPDRLQIQDGETSISVDPSAASDFAMGDYMEAVGTVVLRQGSGLWLDAAIARKIGTAPPIQPLKINAAQIVSPSAAGLLVEMEGILVQQANGAISDLLYLTTPDDDAAPFVAELFHVIGSSSLPHFLPGDRLRLTGVFDVDEVRTGLRGAARRIILRRASEAQMVTRVPFWKRIKWIEITLGTLLFLGAAIAWGWSLRRQVQRKTAALERQSTELVEALDRAEQGARAKTEFLSTMSHEIRTPMNGVIGMTSILLNTALSHDQREFVETIRTSGEALLTVINEILDFSKVESGKLTLEDMDFEVQLLVDQSVDLVAEAARQKNLQLQALVHSEVPPVVVGDPGRMRQVLLNLVSNAVKFTESGSVSVFVRLISKEGNTARLRFEVTDSGIGFSPETGMRLFESFTQADSSTTRRYGGTGLGLAISKRLVELMGGTIGCESRPGAGSTFWFEVPLPIGKPIAPEIPVDISLTGRRILVLDDNPVNRHVIRQILEPAGVIITEAWSGRAALSALGEATERNQPFDAALLDFHMPNMDGLMVAREIRANQMLDKLALIFLSSVRDAIPPAETARLRIAAQLVKPIRRTQVLTELSRVLKATPVAVPAPVREREAEPATRINVLVAEDNPANQKVAKILLERLGCRVDLVGNGAEAFAAWSNGSYDLIFMDCQMPELDGLGATAAIRKAEVTLGCHTPIVALTANAFAEERERCLKGGMDDYLSKPIRSQSLAQTITRWKAKVPQAG